MNTQQNPRQGSDNHSSSRPTTGNTNQSHSAKQQTHKVQALQSDKQVAQSSKDVSNQQQEKVLITGDDILIEYVDRLMNQLKIMGEESLL